MRDYIIIHKSGSVQTFGGVWKVEAAGNWLFLLNGVGDVLAAVSSENTLRVERS